MTLTQIAFLNRKFNQKQADFEKQQSDLLANPNASSEQGKKVKDLGTEIGELEKELHPPKAEDVLNRKLSAFKQMTMIHEHWKKLVEQIEKEIAGKSKMPEQILQEFEEAKQELIVNYSN
jgi:Zn-dependent M32 family carboxypeptidase